MEVVDDPRECRQLFQLTKAAAWVNRLLSHMPRSLLRESDRRDFTSMEITSHALAQCPTVAGSVPGRARQGAVTTASQGR